MKYITQVRQDQDVKHIIEVDGKNVEVIQESGVVAYGNKKGESAFLVNGIKVSRDLNFHDGSSNYIHLAQVVLAIELVRFVLDHLGSNK
jgi:hypothetical protein